MLFYQDKGHLVPTRQLIKTPEQIEGIRRSGVINTGVLDLVERIHAGMSTAEIDKLVYEYTAITELFRQPWGMRDSRKAVVLLLMRWFAMNSERRGNFGRRRHY